MSAMFTFFPSTPTYLLILILPLSLLFLFINKLLNERRRFASLPGPPHHWLFGHIPVLISLIQETPPSLHFLMFQPLLARKPNLTHLPCYYLDLWPLASATCVIQSGALAAQITQAKSLPKDPTIMEFVRGFSGVDSLGPLLEDTSGSLWHVWRRIFNPGFSSAHLLTLAPTIVEYAAVFAERLEEHAMRKDVVRLETLTASLTVDIIGKVVMDAEFNTQRGRSELVESLREIPKYVKPLDSFNPFVLCSPLRMLRHRYYEKRTNRIVREILDQRWAARGISSSEVKERLRQIMDLALEAYDKSERAENQQRTETGINPEFRKIAIANIRGFLFAGHDTTSSSLCYAFHLLSTNPSTLRTIRAEHDRVFGPDISKTAVLIQSKPSLLSPSTIPYTTAVINETLRLYPAAGTVRQGQPGFNLVDPDTGTSYPTYRDGPFSLHIGGFSVHRLASNFPDPDTFDPTRFLPREDGGRLDEMPKDVFRPFEKGRRNCIGSELASLEMRIVLALTVRRFDVEAAYETDEPRVMGERAFPTLRVVAEPVDGLPVRVSLRV